MCGPRSFQDMCEETDQLFRRINGIRPLSESEMRYFYYEFSIADSHNSNAIEGNTFTYDETRLLIKEGVVSPEHSFKEHCEIVGYKRAFDFMYDLAKARSPITEWTIKRLHSLVLMNDGSAGGYRTIQNYIGDMFQSSFMPCAPEFLEKEMSDYVIILNNDIDTIRDSLDSGTIDWKGIFRTVARDHISFERIHPFIDGNGRTGRLLLSYELISSGLLPMDIRYEDSIHYYSAFKEYDRKIGYSAHPEDKIARLMIDSEIRSMNAWLYTFDH